MNTERPDNDDVAPEDGAAEHAGTPRDTDGAVGPAAEKAGETRTPEEAAETASEATREEGTAEAAQEEGTTEAPEPAAAEAGETGATDTAEAEAEAEAEVEAETEEETQAEAPLTPQAPTPAEPEASEETGDPADSGPDATDADADVTAPDAGAPGTAEPSRRRPALVAVSVAAAVLLVGGGGAYFATTASDGSGGAGGRTSGASGDGTPPPLALEGYSGGDGTNGIAPGEPHPNGATYRADGTLPDGPGSAPVYRTGGQVTEGEVAGLAEALGVTGKPVAQGQSWTVGERDGSGPLLRVNKQAPGSWTFQRYAPGTDNCKSTTVCPETPANPSGTPVSEAVAKKAAAPVLKAVGQDDAKSDASQSVGDRRMVNADPIVGGLPTYGWATGVSVDAQGDVVSGSGLLKPPVKSDTYPVLDAEKTLAALNAARVPGRYMGIGGCASPVPLKDRLEAPCESTSAGATVPRETLTVDKAVFGLASQVVDGRQALVPSWLFEVRAPGAQESFTVTHPAIDPKFLASPTPSGEPSGPPSTQPGDPGDEPTSAPATRDVPVDGYTAEGTELTVAYNGGVCGDYKATARESGDEVTVTVTETPWRDKVCIMIAKEYHRTVQLEEPLGDRKVVGSDGKAIPLEKAGARLPETSGAR
ncbi:hypothetical protein SLINC_2491 [Streptomyces lincolnensis]|uniref:Uncharacterized protein n=1 Tax=Streptomyces lincolnensis TaxID=1915 RepID=A0A1B1M7U9_STRLN|nr:hypothetical protein [Streptomyces lincolnensis]ANS64715.1 hypothetical protein SLINC_2491 [Streptomyces lincolnensis]AXG57078.1 hypothetical protein SLCG_5923 [Streptomyces lincolnensis]QMV06522.1 hypothetical protein GJU35_13110 [Streptomyces lincolnensis]